MLKSLIKSLLPKPLLFFYHKTLAVLANVFYGFPSRKMVVIGVTGTKGKSSTVVMITRILEEAGLKVGSTNTIFFKIADKEWPNTTKQGMLGRFKLQKMLRQMVKAGCTHAVIEVTSEGIVQSRQWGMAFDVAVFTNLSPEHIESHGSYEKYREAKGLIFKGLYNSHRKTISDMSLRAPRGYSGQAPRSNPEISSGIAAVAGTLPRNDSGSTHVKKVIVANRSDVEADYFLKFKADEKWGVCDSCENCKINGNEKTLCADSFNLTSSAIGFMVQGQLIHLPLPGQFMMTNALLAMAACMSLDISLTTCKEALEKINLIPGRLEFVEAGQDFKVIVDYAHEPRSFAAILSTGRELAQDHKLIVVFGVTGGGRDKAKRPKMGEMAAATADYIILTTDDPYNDDPKALIADIVPGIKGNKWIENQNWWQVVDRRQAINQALSIARTGDVVLLLGKGSEQVMVVTGGKMIPWNDVEITRELLRNK